MKRQIPASLVARTRRCAATVGSVLAITAVAPVTSPDVSQSLTAQAGPALILEDSVVLREADDHQVGQPVSLIPARDGSFFIADGYSNSVLHFDSRGRHVRTFGQKGEGPGEFQFVSYAGFVAGDDVGTFQACESELVEEVRIGSLDGPDEYVFSHVNSVAVGESGSMYVADVDLVSIREFSPDGLFVRELGRSGEGPGEILAIAGISVLADGRLATWDRRNRRITIYGADGRGSLVWGIVRGMFDEQYVVRWRIE